MTHQHTGIPDRLKHGDVIVYHDTILVIDDSRHHVNGMTFYCQASQRQIVKEEDIRQQSRLIASLDDQTIPHPSFTNRSLEELYALIYHERYSLSDDLDYELRVLCNTQRSIGQARPAVESLIFGFLHYQTTACNIAFDSENILTDPRENSPHNHLFGLHHLRLDSGRVVDIVGLYGGGDWELGVIAMLFINTDHQFEIHVPELPRYNPYNIHTKHAFGHGESDGSDELGAQYLGYPTYEALYDEKCLYGETLETWEQIAHYMQQYLTQHFAE